MDEARAGGGMPKDVGDTKMTKAVCSEQSGPKCHYTSIRVKLRTFDGSKCLEAFLANVKNFAAFLRWNKEKLNDGHHLQPRAKIRALQMLRTSYTTKSK